MEREQTADEGCSGGGYCGLWCLGVGRGRRVEYLRVVVRSGKCSIFANESCGAAGIKSRKTIDANDSR